MANKSNETTVTTNNDLIIEGIVSSAYIGKSRFSDVEKKRIAIKCDTIPYDQITAFKDSGNKLTPSWFKDKTGYINLASIYNIPVKDTRGREITFEEFCEMETSIGSKIKIAIKQSEGALYPKAFVILEDGEPRDAFAGL